MIAKKLAGSICCLLLLAACSAEQEASTTTEPLEPARPESSTQTDTATETGGAQRQAFFGDLHVHSSWSLDSYVNFNPVDPHLAYRFAQGEEVTIAGNRRLQLSRPLDFAAVTDHAEYFGELTLCLDEQFEQYQLPLCADIRNEQQARKVVTRVYKNLIIRDVTSAAPQREEALCGEQGVYCEEQARNMWQKIIKVADTYNRPGEFTTFVAYEWTGNTDFHNMHRNVIFKSNQVPDLPISHFDANTAGALWRQLDQNCQPPCEALAIPHNSNQSKGWQLPTLVSLEDAQLRSELEPLVEIIQGKGGSECQFGVGSADEYCNFDLLEQRRVCAEGEDEAATGCARICADENESGNCIHKNIYYRNALKDGLRLDKKLGVNPYQFGVIGSTDTHNGTPGATDENNFMGLFGAEDGTAERRARIPEIKSFKPPRLHSASGLAGVWAEENTRESIFAAMKRKETFATSGTRIVLRFFAGWGFDDEIDERRDMARQSYAEGVPMGSDLPPAEENAKPGFVFWAMKAVDGAPLQRIQMVKGWMQDGETRELSFDLACSDGLEPDPESGRCPDNGATVDLSNCEISNNSGATEIKGRWRDEDFDPTQPAFYYIRVLENPSCRWSTWDAIREDTPLLEDVPPMIQERAWSSPVWYKPG